MPYIKNIEHEKVVDLAGEALVMPATVPHAVYAVERFKMLLTVVFPIEK